MISEYHKGQGLLHHLSDYQFLEQGLCSVKVVTRKPHKEVPGLTFPVGLLHPLPPPLCFPILPFGCLIVLFTITVVITIFLSVMSFAVVDVGQTQLEGNATVST
jgi:hypothetical protein